MISFVTYNTQLRHGGIMLVTYIVGLAGLSMCSFNCASGIVSVSS